MFSYWKACWYFLAKRDRCEIIFQHWDVFKVSQWRMEKLASLLCSALRSLLHSLFEGGNFDSIFLFSMISILSSLYSTLVSFYNFSLDFLHFLMLFASCTILMKSSVACANFTRHSSEQLTIVYAMG